MKPLVVVTGMHRSGTSFLIRSLNLSGMYIGKLDSLVSHDWLYLSDNKRGHWENKPLLELANKTLLSCNSSWDEITNEIKCSTDIGKMIKQSIENISKPSSLAYGFKDPRFLICYASWLPYIPDNFFIVGIFRHPLDVAESLKKRNGFSYQKSLDLWLTYNKNLIQILKTHKGFLLNFDWPKEIILKELKIIIEKLGLSDQIDLSDWYSEKLLHSNKTSDKEFPLSNEIKEVYQSLKHISENNSNIDIKINHESNELANILENSFSIIQEQGDYFKKLSDNFEASSNEKESQISNLQSDLSSKESQISNLQSDLSSKESQITQLQKIIMDIHNSFTWRILEKYDNLKNKLKLSNK